MRRRKSLGEKALKEHLASFLSLLIYLLIYFSLLFLGQRSHLLPYRGQIASLMTFRLRKIQLNFFKGTLVIANALTELL